MSQISIWFCKFTSLFSRRTDRWDEVSGTVSTPLLYADRSAAIMLTILPWFSSSLFLLKVQSGGNRTDCALFTWGPYHPNGCALSRPINGAFHSRFRTKNRWSLSPSSILRKNRAFGVYSMSIYFIHRAYIYLVRRVSRDHLLIFRDGDQVPCP